MRLQNPLIIGASVAGLACVGIAAPASAATTADPLAATADTSVYSITAASTETIPGCADQITAAGGTAADVKSLCTAKLTTEQAPAATLTVTQAQQMAQSEGLSSADSTALVTAAKAGTIKGVKWKHWYFAGVTKIDHSGTTYYDGSKAWIASYRSLKGSHSCSIEGGYSVGWTVSTVSCNHPAASTKADAIWRFDLGLAFKDSPVTLNVGLRYAVTNKGTVSTWQVGG